MTSARLVPEMTSSPDVPTFVAFLPKHLGFAADAAGASVTSDAAARAAAMRTEMDLVVFSGGSSYVVVAVTSVSWASRPRQ